MDSAVMSGSETAGEGFTVVDHVELEGAADIFPLHRSSEFTGSVSVQCAVRMRDVCFTAGTGSKHDSSYCDNLVLCDDGVASCGTDLLVADGDSEGPSACLR